MTKDKPALRVVHDVTGVPEGESQGAFTLDIARRSIEVTRLHEKSRLRIERTDYNPNDDDLPEAS